MTVNLGHPHPRQLKNAILWLTKMRTEIDDEIKRLNRIKEYDCYDNKKHDARKELMLDLITNKITEAEAEKRMFEMGWGGGRVKDSQKILRRCAEHKSRILRNEEIARRTFVNKESPSALAKEYEISRTQVNRILSDYDPEDRFFKTPTKPTPKFKTNKEYIDWKKNRHKKKEAGGVNSGALPSSGEGITL